MSFDPRPGKLNYSYTYTTPLRSGFRDFFLNTFYPDAQKDEELEGSQTCESLKIKSLEALKKYMEKGNDKKNSPENTAIPSIRNQHIY